MNPPPINPEPPRRPITHFLTASNVRRALIAILLLALAIVFLWPKANFTVHLVTIASGLGFATALMSALTYWKKIRIQIGRHGLRYKAVRGRSALTAVIGLSFLLVRLLSLLRVPASIVDAVSKEPSSVDESTLPLAIAHLQDDTDHKIENEIIRQLSSPKANLPISIVKVDRTLEASGSSARLFSHLNIADYFRTIDADLLLWGSIDSSGRRPVIQLYQTSAHGAGQFGATFEPADFKLPELTFEELIPVLRLMLAVQTEHLPRSSRGRKAMAESLSFPIEEIRKLADSSSAKSAWSVDTRARVNLILGAVTELQGSQTWEDKPVRISIGDFLSSIAAWTAQDHALDRAMALRGLAQTLRTLDRIDHNPEASEAAARAYREAIKIYDSAHDRLDKAWTQYSLGRTLVALAQAGRSKELPEAVESLQAALAIFNKETDPLRWASIQSDIASSLTTLGQREGGTEKLRQAVSILNEVLLVRSRDKVPTEWARTQANLSLTFFELAEREPASSYYADAITAARSALQVLHPETNPTLWAQAQAALGTALSGKGQHEESPGELAEAVTALRLGANDELRERDTGAWVKAQATLTMALDQLGELEWRQESFGGADWKALDQSAQEHFEESVAAGRLGLQVATKQAYPLDWAYLQSKLAESLKTIGQRESGKSKLAAATHLKEAVESGRSALEVMTIENDPQNWADTQDTLGDALQALGKLLSNPSDLEDAISAYKESAKVQTFESDPINWAATQSSIGNVHQQLGMLEAGTAGDSHLQQAVDSYRAALKVTTPENDLSDWMLTQREMARTETALGTREASSDHLQEAAEAYREELKYLSPDRSPYEWKDASEHLNEVLELLRRRGATG